MEELKLISKYPGSLRPLVSGALAAALRSTEEGIRQTQKRLQEFEAKYQLSTACVPRVVRVRYPLGSANSAGASQCMRKAQ